MGDPGPSEPSRRRPRSPRWRLRVPGGSGATERRPRPTADDDRARRQEQARHRAVLDASADGIVTVDPAGRVDGCNRAAEAMFGWTAGDLVGRPYTVLLAASTAAPPCWLAAGHQPAQLHLRRRDGTEFPAQLSLSTVDVDDWKLTTAVVRDLSDREAIAGQLAFMADHDELTGLGNRRFLLQRVDEAIARARAHRRGLGLMCVGIDGLKLVSDSLGLHVGDAFLVHAAARIQEAVRAGDVLARVGSDEFVVLCPDTDPGDTLSAVGRGIAAAFDRPFVHDGEEVFLSVSVGIALWEGPGDAAAELLRRSDTAMVRAKDSGPGSVELFDVEMQASVTMRLDLESALRRALEREEFQALYQPIVRLDSGEVVHFEALARWNRPDGGMVEPSAFIGVAEETGLIVAIGERMLRQAARACAEWQALAPGVGVAVNVSSRQIYSGHLADAVGRAVVDAGLAPGLLSLELTETVLLHDVEAALDLLDELRSFGVRIALDDFGTGYSSLTYLRRLRVDMLKIDKAFVDSIGTDLEDTRLLRTIIGLGAAYDLQPIAEGIDSDLKLGVLRALGCPLGQGYLFSAPLPLEEACRYLQGGPP